MAFQKFLLLALTLLSSHSIVSEANECRIADAALNYDDVIYLFLGPDYVTLDESLQEEAIGNKHDEWNGLERLDAAMMWTDNEDSWWSKQTYPVFFEGSSYSYWSYLRQGTYGPFAPSNEHFDAVKKLGKDVDAAASIGDTGYFFKCCNYMSEFKGHVTEPIPLETLGIPCDVHAAMKVDDDHLGIIKFDQLWLVTVSSANVTGPHDANDYMGLESIKLCSEHQDAGVSIVEEPTVGGATVAPTHPPTADPK